LQWGHCARGTSVKGRRVGWDQWNEVKDPSLVIRTSPECSPNLRLLGSANRNAVRTGNPVIIVRWMKSETKDDASAGRKRRAVNANVLSNPYLGLVSKTYFGCRRYKLTEYKLHEELEAKPNFLSTRHNRGKKVRPRHQGSQGVLASDCQE
jgi:hypothetical protein